ncbi:hypothetical protein SAMN05216174_11190 [Actinokineospora iranica]|uniref:Uncharacterized protein n=1 Tax=Actinokineospora iranica TaxID=1271860 RepID=A0A1G6UU32_9PSEU|nr:hypothetical protein SAMN05216174_11190 [Actinokineospora iranica]
MGWTGQQVYENFANARGTERLSQAAAIVEEVQGEYATSPDLSCGWRLGLSV